MTLMTLDLTTDLKKKKKRLATPILVGVGRVQTSVYDENKHACMTHMTQTQTVHSGTTGHIGQAHPHMLPGGARRTHVGTTQTMWQESLT